MVNVSEPNPFTACTYINERNEVKRMESNEAAEWRFYYCFVVRLPRKKLYYRIVLLSEVGQLVNVFRLERYSKN